mgnify:CR=1 FL=1
MKYMNMKKKFWSMDLQLFAGDGGDGADGSEGEDGSDGEDDDPDDDSEGDDAEEKKFTQKDVDDAVKKRLAREKRKWQREQQKKASGDGTDGRKKAGDDGEEKDNEKLKEAESRAIKAETRAACFEAGVDKDAIDDVTALAHAYMEADEDLDLEDAIEKVVKKYPHFKKGADSSDDADDTKGKSWGERQKGTSKKRSGVEAAFLAKNPGLKID